ncbi:MAG: FUSC family protein [Cyanobium sp. CZS 48M]|nr:FUSC family protein [Cyanobium sp. CZS48M]
MAESRSPQLRERDPRELGWRLWSLHALRTALAVGVSMGLASGLGLSVPYWAPITTIIVTQSTLVDSWLISRRRLQGTALGVVLGAAQVQWLPAGLPAYVAAILLLGLVCGLLRLHQSAYRFGGIALTIVSLVPHTSPVWGLAWYRFVDVSLGILVSLAITLVWPERLS